MALYNLKVEIHPKPAYNTIQKIQKCSRLTWDFTQLHNNVHIFQVRRSVVKRIKGFSQIGQMHESRVRRSLWWWISTHYLLTRYPFDLMRFPMVLSLLAPRSQLTSPHRVVGFLGCGRGTFTVLMLHKCHEKIKQFPI